MSDQPPRTPPPPPIQPLPPPTRNPGLGWLFVVSGAILVVLTVGCFLAVTDGRPTGEDAMVGLVCGSPTLLLGGVFLWLGTRRLKR
ncbi:MAG: hypothetical protein JO339_34235 [Alphaproteobacteria bacterium]|nr:hypothetical protein [Alphaproteobacteria bacterium]